MKDGMTFRVCAFLPIVAAVLSRATPLVAAEQLPFKSDPAPMLCLEASFCQEPVDVDSFSGDDDEIGTSGNFDAQLLVDWACSGLPYTEGHLFSQIDQLGGSFSVFLFAPKNDPPASV